jgi:hypothetical protein
MLVGLPTTDWYPMQAAVKAMPKCTHSTHYRPAIERRHPTYITHDGLRGATRTSQCETLMQRTEHSPVPSAQARSPACLTHLERLYANLTRCTEYRPWSGLEIICSPKLFKPLDGKSRQWLRRPLCRCLQLQPPTSAHFYRSLPGRTVSSKATSEILRCPRSLSFSIGTPFTKFRTTAGS